MAQKKISNNVLCGLHRRGWTVRRIVNEHGGISRVAIYARLKKLGLTPNPPGGRPSGLDIRVMNMIKEILAEQEGPALLEDAVVKLYVDTVI